MKNHFITMHNSCLSRYHYYHRNTILRNKPQVWFIELTNFCNLDCFMCPRGHMKRKIGFMDFHLFKNIIDQIKGYTDFVWLHLYGEPLFHPQLEQFINYCSGNNIKPGISTNATILDNEKAVMLLNSKLHYIKLCLDGSTKETYERIRKHGDFDKTRNNIINFLKLKKKFNKKGLLAEIQIVRMKETDGEIDDFKKQWRNINAYVLVKQFCRFGNQVKSVVEMDWEEQLQGSYRDKRYPCTELWRRGGFLWNGDFVTCCMDFDGNSVAGNLNREKLMNIWNSASMKRLRKEHIENNYINPLCKNCSEWSGEIEDMHYPFSSGILHEIVESLNVYYQLLLRSVNNVWHFVKKDKT